LLRFFIYSLLALLFVGCGSPSVSSGSKNVPSKLNLLIVDKSDKVHYYYTINGKKVKKYVDTYLFHNGRELYPIKKNFYELGRSYKPMLRYWVNSDSTLLLRQYARLGYVDTYLTPLSKYHYVSKPDKEGAVIHFVVMKDSFDRSNFWKPKKVNLKSTKKISHTKSPGVRALDRARQAGRSSGRRQALKDIARAKRGSISLNPAYGAGIYAASSGRTVGTIAIGKFGHQRSKALRYIRSSCKDIDVDNKYKRSATRTCIRAAIAKYNTY